MTAAAARPSALAEIAGSFDWTGRSGRLAFSLAGLTFLAFFALLQVVPTLGPMAYFFWPAMGAVFLIYIGQTRRRIRDLGWRGSLTWLVFVPVLGLLMVIVLCFKRGAPAPRTDESAALRKLGFAVTVLFAIVIVSRAFLHPFSIPSGHMKPNFLVGDYVLVTRLNGAPERGDVVVFKHPVQQVDFFSRILASPGDSLALNAGQVILNGQALPQENVGTFTEAMGKQGPFGLVPMCANAPVAFGAVCEKTLLREALPDGTSYDILDIRSTDFETTAEFIVPEAHVFVMGDNRDNSLDSRLPQAQGGVGFVPIANIVGQPKRVAFSTEFVAGRVWKAVK